MRCNLFSLENHSELLVSIFKPWMQQNAYQQCTVQKLWVSHFENYKQVTQQPSNQPNSWWQKVKSCLQPGLVVWKGMYDIMWYIMAQHIVAQRSVVWVPWIFFHWICTAQRTGCVKTGSRGRWAGAVLNGPALRSLHAPEEPAHSFMHTQSMIKHIHSMETDVLNIICNFWIAWHWKNNGGEGLIVSIEEAWIVGIIR